MGIVALAFVLVLGVVLVKDYWLYQKIEMVIAEAGPNLVASGFTKAQTESITWLTRRVSVELRLEISFLTLMLGIAIVAIVHVLTRSRLQDSRSSSANAAS
jgi:hypothetical protein